MHDLFFSRARRTARFSQVSSGAGALILYAFVSTAWANNQAATPVAGPTAVPASDTALADGWRLVLTGPESQEFDWTPSAEGVLRVDLFRSRGEKRSRVLLVWRGAIPAGAGSIAFRARSAADQALTVALSSATESWGENIPQQTLQLTHDWRDLRANFGPQRHQQPGLALDLGAAPAGVELDDVRWIIPDASTAVVSPAPVPPTTATPPPTTDPAAPARLPAVLVSAAEEAPQQAAASPAPPSAPAPSPSPAPTEPTHLPSPAPAEPMGQSTANVGLITAWQLDLHHGAAAELLPLADDAEGARLQIGNVGQGEAWHVDLFRKTMPVRANHAYQLSFRGRADQTRPFGVALNQAHRPWGNLGFYGSGELTTSWQPFAFDFTANGDDQPRIDFQLGGAATPVEITDLTLSERMASAAPNTANAAPAPGSSAGPMSQPTPTENIELSITPVTPEPITGTFVPNPMPAPVNALSALPQPQPSDNPAVPANQVPANQVPAPAATAAPVGGDTSPLPSNTFVPFNAVPVARPSASPTLALDANGNLAADAVWELETDEPVTMRLSAGIAENQGTVRVALTHLPIDPTFRVRLVSSPIVLTVGQNYELKFRLRSKLSGSVGLNLAPQGLPHVANGLRVACAVGPEWQDCGYQFVAVAGDDLRLQFGLGFAAGDVELSQVSLRTVP